MTYVNLLGRPRRNSTFSFAPGSGGTGTRPPKPPTTATPAPPKGNPSRPYRPRPKKPLFSEEFLRGINKRAKQTQKILDYFEKANELIDEGFMDTPADYVLRQYNDMFNPLVQAKDTIDMARQIWAMIQSPEIPGEQVWVTDQWQFSHSCDNIGAPMKFHAGVPVNFCAQQTGVPATYPTFRDYVTFAPGATRVTHYSPGITAVRGRPITTWYKTAAPYPGYYPGEFTPSIPGTRTYVPLPLPTPAYPTAKSPEPKVAPRPPALRPYQVPAVVALPALGPPARVPPQLHSWAPPGPNVKEKKKRWGGPLWAVASGATEVQEVIEMMYNNLDPHYRTCKKKDIVCLSNAVYKGAHTLDIPGFLTDLVTSQVSDAVIGMLSKNNPDLQDVYGWLNSTNVIRPGGGLGTEWNFGDWGIGAPSGWLR